MLDRRLLLLMSLDYTTWELQLESSYKRTDTCFLNSRNMEDPNVHTSFVSPWLQKSGKIFQLRVNVLLCAGSLGLES